MLGQLGKDYLSHSFVFAHGSGQPLRCGEETCNPSGATDATYTTTSLHLSLRFCAVEFDAFIEDSLSLWAAGSSVYVKSTGNGTPFRVNVL